MAEMVYDKTKKKMIPLAEAKAAEKEDLVYLSLPKSVVDKLVGFADEDGVDRSADTELGKKVRTTNVVKKYVMAALNEFIEARGKATPTEPAPESE